MFQASKNNKAASDPRASGRRGMQFIAGAIALAAMLGGAGCVGISEGGEEEAIASVSQAERREGTNGIPPEVLLGGYLMRSNTDSAGVTSPLKGDLIELCSSFVGNLCTLRPEWKNWLNPNQTNPPDAHTVLRGRILEALIEGSMEPQVIVRISPTIDVKGMFGMFPLWIGSRLGGDEQEFLSAFIAMKVNAFGATVPIGVVGPGPGPAPPEPIDNPAYTFQEAVFFGNLFGVKPEPMRACVGAQNAAGGTVVGLSDRICSQPGNPCNIEVVGSCSTWCNIWDGVGLPTGEHCAVAKDPMGGTWHFPLTTYMRVDPL